jgi:exopolysaccharide biosynthesis polyprenyl glycosylphosphotransferase
MPRIFNLQISIWKLLLFSGDLVCYGLSVVASLYLNPNTEHPWEFLAQNHLMFIVAGLVYFSIFLIGDLYDLHQDYHQPFNLARLTVNCWVGTVVGVLIVYFPFRLFVHRTQVIIQALSFAGTLVVWRTFFSAVAFPQRLQKKALIVGAGKSGKFLLQSLRQNPQGGILPVGFVDDDPQKVGTVIEGAPVLGTSKNLRQLIADCQISLLAVAITHEKSDALVTALTQVYWSGCKIVDMPSLFESLEDKLPLDHISDSWLLLNSLSKPTLYYRYFKRVMDLILSGSLLIPTLPLFGLIALAIKLDSPGPVFYRQERLGHEGQPFQIIKFRTMVENAEIDGQQWSRENDPRVTRVGNLLRKMRLDELPQLINVFKGEMSFIGPRPERPIFIKEFSEPVPEWRLVKSRHNLEANEKCVFKEKIPFYSYRLLVKPGLTGWAQVMYPYASSLEESREKLMYDLYYIKNMGFLLDVVILLKTVRIVLFGARTLADSRSFT